MADQLDVTRSRGDRMADVDASDDPQARVRYLDIVTSQLSEYKQESYTVLGLCPGMSVLDVGCGAGDDVRALAEIVGPTGRAVGLDLSSTMVEQARARSGSLPVEFVQGSVYELPFADDSFDASRSDRVFQHLDEPLRALLEMVRVTKPGGRINVIDPDWGTEMVDTDQRELARRARESWWRRRDADAPGDRWRGRQRWGLFNQAGLVDLQIEGGLWCVTDLDVATHIAGVLDWVRDAYEAGDATLDEAENWEREMRERAATGRFFAGAGGVGVVGTVPGKG